MAETSEEQHTEEVKKAEQDFFDAIANLDYENGQDSPEVVDRTFLAVHRYCDASDKLDFFLRRKRWQDAPPLTEEELAELKQKRKEEVATKLVLLEESVEKLDCIHLKEKRKKASASTNSDPWSYPPDKEAEINNFSDKLDKIIPSRCAKSCPPPIIFFRGAQNLPSAMQGSSSRFQPEVAWQSESPDPFTPYNASS